MVLHIHSDAVYLAKNEARSHTRGHFFLSSTSSDPSKPPTAPVLPNRPIHMVYEILHSVMVSVTEVETGVFFTNACKGEELHLALEEMGHPQPPMLVMTDNSTTRGILNKTVKQKRNWVINIRFYWVCNWCAQDHFIVIWQPRSENLGDSHTKHCSAA
eukprot:6799185-Ditylum_brightwellii.AAC.1